MRKIGIMGGTFNPVHNGHILVATAAREQFLLDEIWWIPSKNPPHKKDDKIASNQERMDMLQLAIEPYPFFVMSSIEMEREGYSYTADTLTFLKEKNPADEYYFIIGADSLHYIDKWKDPEVIFRQAVILSAPRYPSTSLADQEQKEYLEKKYGGKISFIQMEPVEISSTDILKRLKKGKDVSGLLPNQVINYIKEQELYEVQAFSFEAQTQSKKFIFHSVRQIREVLQKELPKKRYLHTLGVQHTAACLAMRYKEDFRKAGLAGLLHDCAKCMEDEIILKKCIKYGLPVSDTEKRNPFLLHGKLGAYYARTRFEIQDDEILNAIIYHTTGRPNMSLLEKIIFIADYIEPERKEIPGLEKIREIAFEDLDKAMFLALENTLHYLRKEKNTNAGNEIDETTVEAYYYYKNKVEGV